MLQAATGKLFLKYERGTGHGLHGNMYSAYGGSSCAP